jgi:uncharacterized protein with LGFP repeats
MRWVVVPAVVVPAALAVGLSPIGPEPLYAGYTRVEAERSFLGYPTSNERPSQIWPGRSERAFDGGVVVADAEGQGGAVSEGTLRAYLTLGGVDQFGFPTGGQTEFKDGSRVTWFDRAALVRQPSGAIVTVEAPLLARWCRPGRACSLGPPIGPAVTLPSGAIRQEFAGGAIAARPNGTVRVARDPS